MGSDTKCLSCEYEHATSNANLRNGEGTVFCDRCGYHYSLTRRYNVERTKDVFNQVKEFMQAHRLSDAVLLLTITTEGLAPEMQSKLVEDWCRRAIESDFKIYYLFDEQGEPLFDEQEEKNLGSFRYRAKGCVSTECGGYLDEQALIDRFRESIAVCVEFSYTKKIDEKWMTITLKKVEEFKGQDEVADVS